MVEFLDDHALEEDSYTIPVVFTDEDGKSVVPNELQWKLIDGDENVINEREDEDITPASTIYVTLYGDDLALQEGESSRQVRRYLVVYGTYDSTYGTNLTLKRVIGFWLDNQKGVPL